MLEAYSQNVTVAANGAIPLNSTSLQKGCTAVKSGVATIALNKCGVYMVSVDGSAAITGATAANITVQLLKDGVAQPQALSTNQSTSTTDIESLSFMTLVQVSDDNSSRCCDSPVTISLQNTGASALFSQINIVVTKVK